MSPKGVSRYPKLLTPDTKFKTEGEYSVKLAIPEAEAQDLVKLIEEAQEASFQKASQDPKNKGKKIKRADPPFVVEEDGTHVFNFKMAATGETDGRKWNQRPTLVDAKRTVISDPTINIGGGTVMKVSFGLNLWFTALLGAGVKLALKGAQLLELKAFQRDLGFSDEEGYTAQAAESDDFDGSPDPSEPPAEGEDKEDF